MGREVHVRREWMMDRWQIWSFLMRVSPSLSSLLSLSPFLSLSLLLHTIYAYRFSVTGSRKDTTPPALQKLSLPFNVPMVKDKGPGLLEVEVCVKEEESGLQSIEQKDNMRDSCPSFLQIESMASPAPQVLTHHFDRYSFHPSPSCFSFNISFPIFAWPGMWRVRLLYLSDEAGNAVTWRPSDFQFYHVRSNFHVTNINLTYTGLSLTDYVDIHYDPYYYYHDDEAYYYK